MGKLFSIDGKAFCFLSSCADLVVLNILWIICCLPVVTIGASTTALHYVALKMAKGEEAYIVKSFFHSFIENFRQATVIWMSILACAAVLFFDFYYIGHTRAELAGVLAVVIFFIAILLSITICYIFPMLSYFKCSTFAAVKNALFMAIAHLPDTVLLLALALLPVGMVLLLPDQLAAVTFLDVIIGFAGCAYVGAFIYHRIFRNYIPEGIANESEA